MHLEGTPSVLEFDPFQQFTAGTVAGPVTGSQFQYAPTHNVGEKVELADGRIFRYATAGASNLVAGTLQQPAAEKTNHQEISPVSAIANFTTVNQVNVTLGATAAVLNEYYNGFLTFSSGGNVGLSYLISYHPAANSSANLLVNLYDFLQAAVLTSDTVDLIHNNWYAVIQSTGNAAAQTTRPGGVPMIAATTLYGCWIATHGMTGCVADSTVAVGTELVASASTAGAVTGRSTTYSTAVAQELVGVAGAGSAIATNSKPILLKID
jgi:hypothetical protein